MQHAFSGWKRTYALKCVSETSLGSEFKDEEDKEVITESVEKRHEFRNRLLSGVAWARFDGKETQKATDQVGKPYAGSS